MFHKKKPRVLQAVFQPFAERIKVKWVNWFMGIGLSFFILGAVLGALMIKYPGWYEWLKQVQL